MTDLHEHRLDDQPHNDEGDGDRGAELPVQPGSDSRGDHGHRQDGAEPAGEMPIRVGLEVRGPFPAEELGVVGVAAYLRRRPERCCAGVFR